MPTSFTSTHKIQWPILSILPLLFLLAGCSTAAASKQTTRVTPVEAGIPAWFNSAKKQGLRTHGQYIAAEAIALSTALYGPQANQYYTDDPTMTPVIAYWKQSCQNTDGSLCAEAKSGNLQCVEFVSAVFAQIDDELPYGGDADQFWSLYQHTSGWQEYPVTAFSHYAPEPGDILAWSGNDTGHLAIVVDVQVPTGQHDGFITIAQANAPDALQRLFWHANGEVDSWSGYQLQGLIRQQDIAPCLQQGATPIQEQWETQAVEAAVYYGIPSRYFLRQLCQNDFHAQSGQGQPPASGTTGIGIAQLPVQVAAQIPRCVIDFTANPQHCDQYPGSLPAGTGINPALPAEAIPAAAYEMWILYTHYTGNHLLHTPQDDVLAYTMALAAYHSGQHTVDQNLDRCGKTHWLKCLNEQEQNTTTSNYIDTILSMKNSFSITS